MKDKHYNDQRPYPLEFIMGPGCADDAEAQAEFRIGDRAWNWRKIDRVYGIGPALRVAWGLDAVDTVGRGLAWARRHRAMSLDAIEAWHRVVNAD